MHESRALFCYGLPGAVAADGLPIVKRNLSSPVLPASSVALTVTW